MKPPCATSLAVMLAMASLPAAAGEPPPGAASCSGCHATGAKVDSTVPRLIGRGAADIVAQLQAFRTGQKQATVMDRIVKGFSDAEIQAIAQWYAAQP